MHFVVCFFRSSEVASTQEAWAKPSGRRQLGVVRKGGAEHHGIELCPPSVRATVDHHSGTKNKEKHKNIGLLTGHTSNIVS